ncbi:MAG: hypothetical protein AB1689_25110 [Thermodesulfobacteriota bacterium]
MRARSSYVIRALVALSAALLVSGPGSARDAAAGCGCSATGIPVIQSVKMRGNDLREVRGACAVRNGMVELIAQQQHLKRQKVCPPDCPSGNNYSYCINQCRWTTIARTRADSNGRFTFSNIDASYALQLIASLPSEPNGLDGVYTALRLRSQGPNGKWSQWVNEPWLQAFNLSWPGYEGGFAYVEGRVSGATQMHVTVADGPDDGDQPSIALDVDEDTPNFWLRDHPEGTVEYTRWGICDPSQGCPTDWHIVQSPSISVASPPLGRGSEFPWVLGMITAARPGGMFIATSIMGPRDIPDVSVQVGADVDIDFDLGFSFFSLF